MRTALHLALAALGTLSGCASFMSGLDGETSFACKAPAGVSCQSISGTYHNSMMNNLPSQRKGEGEGADKQPDKSSDKPAYGGGEEGGAKLSPRDMAAMNSGMPIRQPPLVVRVWIAPWEDDGGDLHDQSYFYTVVHTGRWMIESNRSAISGRFKPVYPLSKTISDNAAKAEAAQPTKSDYSNLVKKPDTDGIHVDR